MFGYVTPNADALDESALAAYKSGYCGICNSLARHGLCGRLMLSYDLTFLFVLLTALYDPDTETGTMRCPANPFKKQTFMHNRFADYAADMNFLLGYKKLEDDKNDDGSLPAAAGSAFLKRRYDKLSIKYPVQSAAVEQELSKLSVIEKQRTAPMDEASACFGRLLGTLFVPCDDMWAPLLYETGSALGRFIYMMDAYEDLPRDLKKGLYNPLIPIADKPDFEERAYDILTVPMSECTTAFEKLPLDEGIETLRNILYSGVWSRFSAIHKKRDRSLKGKNS